MKQTYARIEATYGWVFYKKANNYVIFFQNPTSENHPWGEYDHSY